MTAEIALVLLILGAALVLFVTELIRMDLVALLVLASLALTGLVSPAGALAGFSNPAVISVWAMFILSAGLTRTGVADVVGGRILRWVGRGETQMIGVIMLVAAVLSAFMNNIGVAALMLPVVVNVARRTDTPPSRLLIPLAFGSLLGGLTTLIGTPPNLLVSQALRERGLEPFSMFDYTPVGGAVMVAGIAFVALAGRFLLPRRDPAREASSPGLLELQRQYQLDERSAVVRLPADSPLSGKTLQESRIGSSTGLMVYAILRGGRTRLAPGPDDVLQVGDRLLVAGKLARINEMRGWRELIVDEDVPGLDAVVSGEIGLAELNIAAGSALAGQTLEQVGFRLRFGGIVLAIRRGTDVTYANLGRHVLQIGDRLLVQARRTQLEALIRTPDFRDSEPVSESDLVHRYQLQKRIFTVRVPGGSALEGQSLAESRLGDAVGLGVIGLRRGETTHLLPERDEVLHGEDVLVVRGRRDDLTTFKGLQALEIESEPAPDLRELEPERVGLLEAMLSPRTSFAGKSPRQLGFRQRYGLQVMAILREGRVHRSNLRDTALRFGDALLLLGPQEKLQFVARDPEFLVLSDVPQPIADKRRAPIAVLIMAAVVLPVILGWLPISISAVSGAALMVLLRCLSMDQALLAIDWRSVFLIAGMLPLGTALQETGAAGFVAEGMLAGLGDVGPRGVLLVVCLLTAVLTSVVPTAALVVLMAPIAFKAAASAGLAPHAVMMAVAMAASASFTSPVSHPANLMVMGPGGYRFVDYVKVGVPLTLIILLVVLLVVPLCWSLEG